MASVRCKARTKSTGEQCRNQAIPGGTVCSRHGGNARQVRAAAERRVKAAEVMAHAERALRRLGEPEAIDPAEALLERVNAKRAEVLWLRTKVEELASDHDLVWGKVKEKAGEGAFGPTSETVEAAQVNIWYELLHKAEDQLVRYTVAALNAGVEERRIRVEESYATQLVAFANQLAVALGIQDRTDYDQAVRGTLELMAGTGQ